MNSDYAFISRWPVALSREQLWDVVDELLASDDPLVWWPSVQISGYDGTSMQLRVPSLFGYAVSFTLSDLEAQRPKSLRFASTGDLRGSGTISFVEDGAAACHLRIDWRVSTERGWMRRTAWLLRPVFVTGHHLAMRRGRRSLTAWLDQRESRGGPDIV
ncbi:MAG: hypothetical protein ABWX74_16450 [Aeromicrobium sp.]